MSPRPLPAAHAGEICDAPTCPRLERLGLAVVHERRPDARPARGRTPPGPGRDPRPHRDARRAPPPRAPNLSAIINVEGNFLPNVDYVAALDRGIHVLNASPAFALPVAEAALGMAIDLARGISAADCAMRAGTETYGLEGNAEAFLLAGSPVGIVGFGDLGRALRA